MAPLFDESISRRQFLKWTGLAAAGSSLTLTPALGARDETNKPNLPSPKADSRQLSTGISVIEQEVVDVLTPKDFSHLPGKLPGLSDDQISAHIKLYEGYVNRANLLHQRIASADDSMIQAANTTYAPFREMHAEQSYAHNGVVLHELYFGNLGFAGDPTSQMEAMVNRSFGSWDNYIVHLRGVGKTARGWALTGLDLRDGSLRNYGLDQHNQGVPLLVYPILALDVYEHAYFIDYGTDRNQYLDILLQSINWPAVNKRLLYAVHHLMSGPGVTT